MKKVKKLVSIVLMVLIFLYASLSAMAVDSTEFDSTGSVVCAANKGDFSLYPECSLPAIESAFDIGAKIVCVNVRLTKDNVAVIIEDESADRTLISADGKAASGNIEDLTFSEISQYYLKNNDGSVSQYKVMTFKQVMAQVPDDKFIMVKNAWGVRDSLDPSYNDKLILRMDVSKNEVYEWYITRSAVPATICYIYNGSIVFPALSTANYAKNNGGIVEYTSKNVNSIVFSEFFGGKINKKSVPMMADLTDYRLCGERIDDSVGYDELATAGYNIIITNHAQSLCNYIKDIETAKAELNEAVNVATDKYENDNCTKDSKKKLMWAIEASDEALSLSQIHQAINNIGDASNKLVYVKGDGTFATPVRIIIVVIVGVIFAAIDIILYKKPKKKHKD